MTNDPAGLLLGVNEREVGSENADMTVDAEKPEENEVARPERLSRDLPAESGETGNDSRSAGAG